MQVLRDLIQLEFILLVLLCEVSDLILQIPDFARLLILQFLLELGHLLIHVSDLRSQLLVLDKELGRQLVVFVHIGGGFTQAQAANGVFVLILTHLVDDGRKGWRDDLLSVTVVSLQEMVRQ